MNSCEKWIIIIMTHKIIKPKNYLKSYTKFKSK